MNNSVEKLRKFYDENGIIDTSKMTGLSYQRIIDILNLNYVTFDDLKFEKMEGGVKSKKMFPNGYGVSVVSHQFSYGGNMGLYELAVLDENGDLTYTTPITDDVIGYLKPEKVTEILIEIQDLKN